MATLTKISNSMKDILKILLFGKIADHSFKLEDDDSDVQYELSSVFPDRETMDWVLSNIKKYS